MRQNPIFYRRRYHFHQLSEQEMLIELLTPVISIIVIFLVLTIMEYGRVLLIILIAVGSGLIMYGLSVLCVKRIRYLKQKKAYLTTDFFKENEIPFSKEILSRELNFEITVYNSIRETIGKRYYLLHQYKIPKCDSSQSIDIDLLLFHTSGIYVIETMNLTANSIAKVKQKEFRELKLEEKTDYNLFNMDKLERIRQYEKWIKSNTTRNPLLTNKKKVAMLETKYGVQFESALIFSTEMLMGEENVPKTVDSIYSEKEFMEHLKSKKTIYSDHQLYRVYQAFRDEGFVKCINM